MKKLIFKIFVLIAGFFSFNSDSFGQIAINDSILTKILDSDVLIPILLDSAIENNPSIGRAKNQVEMLRENNIAAKREIWKGISFVSSYNYGNATDFALTKDPSTTNGMTSFRTGQSDRFNVGVFMQIPLSTLLNQKNITRSNEYLVKMALSERDNFVLIIEQEIIRLYQEMKLAHKHVVISGKNRQSQLINHKMGEKEFLQGNSNLESLSRLYDMYNKAVIENEAYINKFQLSILHLQLLSHTNLSDLIKKIK